MLQLLFSVSTLSAMVRMSAPIAFAAVGSAYTLMTFLTSILIGMCMGSGALFSFYYGRKEEGRFCAGSIQP